MFQQIRIATLLLISMTLLTGCVYPVLVTVIAQLTFPYQANGSLLKNGDATVGSELIGQDFTRPKYFWGRLSATGSVPYNAAASSGSNYGPLHPALSEAAKARMAALRASGLSESGVPVDLVTASGSGLDPHISPAAAEFQILRIASTRNIARERVQELVNRHTEGRQLGVLGEPRVNVLRLNLALDEQKAR